MNELRIWLNGTLVPPAEAVLPVNSAAVFYGTNVFEGLRAYWNEADEELYCFRLQEHFTRLRESMKMMRFSVPYSDVDLYEAARQVLRGSAIREDVHMHLVAYVVGMGMDATSPTGLYINPRRRGRVSPAGLSCCVSSWTRTSDNAIPIRLKCGPNYQNGRLALLQAKADGYDAPILMNAQGHAAGDRRRPRVHHACDPHRGGLPERPRAGGRRAGDRPHRALRRRRGVLLRERLRDHADRLDRPVSARRR